MPKQKEIIISIVDERMGETTSGPSIPGKSAYDIAVENGFIGTIEEWLLSLHGADGNNGNDGAPGTTGTPGRDGIDGEDGYTPVKGVDYFDGSPGTPGTKGDKGDRGDQGLPGQDGSDASVTKVNVEAVLTGEILTHTHPGGSGGLNQQQILRMI
jgi:hypothetical protein